MVGQGVSGSSPKLGLAALSPAPAPAAAICLPRSASSVSAVFASVRDTLSPGAIPRGSVTVSMGWKLYGSLSRPDPTYPHHQNYSEKPVEPGETRKRPTATRLRSLMVRKGVSGSSPELGSGTFAP